MEEISKEEYGLRILNAITILKSVSYYPRPLNCIIENAINALLGETKKYNKEIETII